MIAYTLQIINDIQSFLMNVPFAGDMRPLVLYSIIFLSSLLESVPIVGTFAPGTLLLLLFGFISTHQKISLYLVILGAATGGVIGDLIGYYVGKYFFKYITRIKRVKKYGKLESGEAFFHRHGGKSVLIARFIGPIRPIVPVLAGAIKMPMGKFLFWNISGSFLWATTYICIGYFFGANFRTFAAWASRAGIFAFIIIVVLIALYGWKEKKTQQVLDELEAADKGEFEVK